MQRVDLFHLPSVITALAMTVVSHAADHPGNPIFPGWYADPEADANSCQICMDDIRYDEQGLIQPEKITTEGVSRKNSLVNYFGKPLAMLSQRCLNTGLLCESWAAALSARARFPASQS
jgi:hypothetical protein